MQPTFSCASLLGLKLLRNIAEACSRVGCHSVDYRLAGRDDPRIVQRSEGGRRHRLGVAVLVPAPRDLLVVVVHVRSRLCG